ARILVKAEGIEGGCRISIEQCLTQGIGVDNPAVALHPAIFAITKAGFPVPSLKIISQLTQITFEAAGKLVIIRCNLDGARPGFQRTVSDEGGELGARRCSSRLSLRQPRIESSRRGILRHGKWIECVLNWYAEANPRRSD